MNVDKNAVMQLRAGTEITHEVHTTGGAPSWVALCLKGTNRTDLPERCALCNTELKKAWRNYVGAHIYPTEEGPESLLILITCKTCNNNPNCCVKTGTIQFDTVALRCSPAEIERVRAKKLAAK